jgi:hypothetical protein
MGAGISVVMMTNDYACCRQMGRRNFGKFRGRSGADDDGRRRIEMPVGVDGQLGTKAAQGARTSNRLFIRIRKTSVRVMPLHRVFCQQTVSDTAATAAKKAGII